MSWTELIIVTITTLLPIVDPVGAVPLFLGMTANDTPQTRTRQLSKACLMSVGLLVLFLIAGNLIITFFGISVAGIRIAGGLLLARLALDMLHAEHKHKQSPEEVDESIAKPDISFVPLTMPILSGPGAIAAVLSLTSLPQRWFDYSALIAGIATVMLLTWLTLQASTRVIKIMGVSGMNALTRMMGFLTLCVGVQFIINGVANILTDPEMLGKFIEAIHQAQ